MEALAGINLNAAPSRRRMSLLSQIPSKEFLSPPRKLVGVICKQSIHAISKQELRHFFSNVFVTPGRAGAKGVRCDGQTGVRQVVFSPASVSHLPCGLE